MTTRTNLRNNRRNSVEMREITNRNEDQQQTIADIPFIDESISQDIN